MTDMDNMDNPKDVEKTSGEYVPPRLRKRFEDEEEEKSTGSTIAVIGLVAVIVLGGGLLLVNMNNSKKAAARAKIEAAEAAKVAAADSTARADSMAVIARADSATRALAAAEEAKHPKPKAAPAATAGGTPSAAGTGETAPPPAPPKFGIAVGEFLFDDKAAAEKDRLASVTSLEGSVVPKKSGGATTYQVVLGPFDSKAAAEAKGAELLAAGTVKESRVISMKR